MVPCWTTDTITSNLLLYPQVPWLNQFLESAINIQFVQRQMVRVLNLFYLWKFNLWNFILGFLVLQCALIKTFVVGPFCAKTHHQFSGDVPTLTGAGSSCLTLRWRVPAGTKPEDVRAEWRPSGWLISGTWRSWTNATEKPTRSGWHFLDWKQQVKTGGFEQPVLV